MVMRKAIDNLKERPGHERRAVAVGIAIAVVAVLFLGWSILFFKKIQGGSTQIKPSDVSQQARDQ